MVYLYIIQCKNCSAVLYCGIVLGRIWTDQGRHKAVDKTAFPTIGNAHHSHPQPLPILPITTALLKHSCMLNRIASRLFKLWQLLEPLQVFASSFPPAGEGGWEIKGWTDRSRTLQLQPIKWKTPPIEGCSKHPWQVSAVINAMTSILKELLWIINSIWWSQNTDIYIHMTLSRINPEFLCQCWMKLVKSFQWCWKYCFPNLHWIHWAIPWWSDSAHYSNIIFKSIIWCWSITNNMKNAILWNCKKNGKNSILWNSHTPQSYNSA